MRRAIRGNTHLKGLKRSGSFKSGNPRYYYRRVSPPIALPDAPIDSPTFLEAYAAAVRQEPQKVAGAVRHRTGSIGAGVRAFLASDDYLSRRASTRARWVKMAEEIEAIGGRGKLTDLQPKHIRQHLQRYGPHAANNRLKVWRALGRWWVDAGLLDADPARDVRRHAVPKSGGFTPWAQEDVDAFRAHWPIGSMQRLALEILVCTGAAIGDAVTLGPVNVKGGWIEYTRTKSGTICTAPTFTAAPPYYPSSADLRACLDAAPKHLTWLSTKRGASRSPKAAGSWFSRAAKAAGIEGKSAHGVRKYLAAYMAERGATEAQRMAILGHDTTSQARDYAKSADARRVILQEVGS